jgi:hypothetical protein
VTAKYTRIAWEGPSRIAALSCGSRVVQRRLARRSLPWISTATKKIPRYEYQEYGDLHIFGLTADEEKRITRFVANNPDLLLEWNLQQAGVTKEHCYQIIKDAGIALPVMYSLGFKNNNCIGCVKATSAKYWDLVRKHFPAIFWKRARQSRELNVRLVRYHGVRMFLDELPDPITDKTPEEDIECGPICLVERIKPANTGAVS